MGFVRKFFFLEGLAGVGIWSSFVWADGIFCCIITGT